MKYTIASLLACLSLSLPTNADLPSCEFVGSGAVELSANGSCPSTKSETFYVSSSYASGEVGKTGSGYAYISGPGTFASTSGNPYVSNEGPGYFDAYVTRGGSGTAYAVLYW